MWAQHRDGTAIRNAPIIMPTRVSRARLDPTRPEREACEGAALLEREYRMAQQGQLDCAAQADRPPTHDEHAQHRAALRHGPCRLGVIAGVAPLVELVDELSLTPLERGQQPFAERVQYAAPRVRRRAGRRQQVLEARARICTLPAVEQPAGGRLGVIFK